MHSEHLVGVLSTLTAPLLPSLLKALLEEGVENVCVIADEKLASAKDQRIWVERTQGRMSSPENNIYNFAAKGIPFYFVKNHNGQDCLTLLNRLSPALLINGGTPRKLSASLLGMPSQGVINVHPGLLPKYRGACCVEWAILNDDPVGNTAHFMSDEYDQGPILASEPCIFTPDDDYVSIRVQVYRRSISLMAKAVKEVLQTGIGPADLPSQGDGILFRPISDEQLLEVIEKVRTGSYLHMKGI